MTICINEISIGNTLVELGAAINVMSMTTMQTLQLYNLLRPTPTILELADRSTVKPIGALDDITVTVASWEYHGSIQWISWYSKPNTQWGNILSY